MPAPGARLPSLTALRWVAATGVFAFHAGVPLPEGSVGARLWALVSEPGGIGVSLFFVLSGFVLAWSAQPGDRPVAFLRRRAARLLPAFWLCAALGLLVAADTGAPVTEGLWSLSLLHAWHPSPQVHFGGNSVSWSLSAELAFYAALPLLLLALRGAGPRTCLLVAAGAVLVAWATPLALRPDDVRSTAFWLISVCPAQRLADFVVGVAVALALRRGARVPVPVPVAVILALGAFVLAGRAPVWLAQASITVVPFALLIVVLAQADADGRPSVLHHPALVRLGQWSYAFYLVHQLVLREAAEHLAATGAAARVGLVAGCYTLALALAGALFHWVEHPLERRLRADRRSAAPTEEPAYLAARRTVIAGPVSRQ